MCQSISSSSAAATSPWSSRRCTGGSVPASRSIEKGPRLTSREDEDVSAAIKEILEAEGIDVDRRAPTRISIRQARQRFRGDHRARAPQPIAGTHLLHGGRAAAQHRRSRPRARPGVETDAPRLHRRRRPAAHQRRAHLGDGRLQRARRVHPHLVQRLRDRRRQPARRRSAPGQRPHHRPTRCTSTRRWAARA